MSENC